MSLTRTAWNDRARAASARLSVTEPLTYHPSGQWSFFLDAVRAIRLQDRAAQARLAQHQRETGAEMPKRREARARAAAKAYEEAFAPAGTGGQR